MAELICPKAEECPLTNACWHAEYHDPDPDGWCSRAAHGGNGCPVCITREEAKAKEEKYGEF